MNDRFDPQSDFTASVHGFGCRCRLHSRRLFTGALVVGATLPALGYQIIMGWVAANPGSLPDAAQE
jgi:hypothetical protein